MADDYIKFEKTLAAVAGLTVAACAVYAGNKYIKNRTDGLIKSTDVLQRIEMRDTQGKLNDTFFMSKGSHDNKRYLGLLGDTRQRQTGHAYLMKLQAKGDVRVASREKAVNAFGDLYKNDPEFRSSVEKYAKRHFSGRNSVDVNNLSNRNIRKMYDNFNSSLIHIRESGSGADKKFYDKLKGMGYGAIQDMNDMKYSGYKAKNPLIVFDNAKGNIMVKSVRELDDNDHIFRKRLIEQGKISKEQSIEDFMNTTLPAIALGTTGASAGIYGLTNASLKTEQDNKQKR